VVCVAVWRGGVCVALGAEIMGAGALDWQLANNSKQIELNWDRKNSINPEPQNLRVTLF
jgi:hypothetical protein